MRTEKTLTAIFILGLILKYTDTPGSSVLLIFTAMIISMLYFPMAFYFFSDKELKNQNIVFSILGGMAMALLPIGVIFKIMYWPGATTSLIGGVFLGMAITGIAFGLRNKADANLKVYYKNYITRSIFWTSLGIICLLIPSSVLINLQHRNDPELARLKIRAYTNPEKIEYQKDLDRYYITQDSLQMVKWREEKQH